MKELQRQIFEEKFAQQIAKRFAGRVVGVELDFSGGRVSNA